MGPRRGRLAGRLSRPGRGAAGSLAASPRRRTRGAARRGARARRALRRAARRRRSRDPARRHALAVAQLLRLLPGKLVGSVDPRRAALRRPRRAGHAVGDQPGLHRARGARARLAGGHDGAARGLQVRWTRRGRDPGQRVERGAVRHPGGARARHRRPFQSRAVAMASWSPTLRPRPTPRSPRASGSRASAPTTCAWSRSIGEFAMRPDDLARRIDDDRAAGSTPFFVCAHRGHHVVAGDGSAARDRGDLPRARRVAPRRRRDGGHRRALPRAAPLPRRRRARRQLLLRSAQVDVHQLRLHLSCGWRIAAR